MEQEEIYRHLWAAHAIETEWDKSLKPRSPDLLFDIVASLGINPSWTVIDVGCGRGNHVCELAQRFDCQVQGLELVPTNLEICAQSTIDWNVSGRVAFVQGSIEAIPIEAPLFDLVWCRDMLVHVQELGQGLRECYRVLKPDGFMLVLTTFATDLMEPQEQGQLCRALDLKAENLSRPRMEQSFRDAGFRVLSGEWLGSELAEFYEERDGRYSRELLRIARMRREVGQDKVNSAVSLGLYTWGVYQLLGKLGVMIYVLKKEA